MLSLELLCRCSSDLLSCCPVDHALRGLATTYCITGHKARLINNNVENTTRTTRTLFSFVKVFLCPCMAINVSVQYNGGLLLDIIIPTCCVAPINVDASRDFFIFLLFLRTSSARGGGDAARLFLFLFFPVQQTTSGIGHRVK